MASLSFQSLWGSVLASSQITHCSSACGASAESGPQTSPRVIPLGQPQTISEHSDSLSVLRCQASRKWLANFVNLIHDIKFLITDTKFSLLGDLKLQATLFIFIGKPLPNVGHILLGLIHALSISCQSGRRIMLHLLDDQAIHFQVYSWHAMLLLGQGAVQAPLRYFSGSGRTTVTFLNKGLQFQRKFRSFDFSSISGSLSL